MPFDLIGYAEAAPGTGTPGITGASGDTLYRVVGDDIVCKVGRNLLLGIFYGAESTPGYARIKQPGLLHYFECIKANDINGITITDSASNGNTHTEWGLPMIEDLRERPLVLKEREKINVYSNNATDEDTLIGLMIGTGMMPRIPNLGIVPLNDFKSIRGTVDQTITAVTWTAGTVTWSQDLPEGVWSVVGMKAGFYKSSGAGTTLVRLTNLNHPDGFRPGVVGQYCDADKIEDFGSGLPIAFSYWPIMDGIEFEYNDPPNVECLSPYANTDFAVEIQVVRKSGA